MPSRRQDHPVVVIGAGPIGLAAAAHLLEQGLEPLVLEAGPSAGTSVREWGHVRLFSPWAELVDPRAARLLDSTGWRRPDGAAYPTGDQWADDYLEPLAKALDGRVCFGTRVIGVARYGRDRVVDSVRDEQPLTVHTEDAFGMESRTIAGAVIDASGTWSMPNPTGADGYPAAGERFASERVNYRIPDLRDPATRRRYAGRRTAVVGSGHSALTALVTLSELAGTESGTQITWVLRRGSVGDAFGRGDADQLPARSALGQRAEVAVAAGHIDILTEFRTAEIRSRDGHLTLVAEDERSVDVDQVVTLTGFRPDLSWESELRLDLDGRLQAPVALAPLIDPDIHSCGTVPRHGADVLAHPESDVYLVGMKSYGRAPTFLARTGYEQVRSVAAALAGDSRAAERVEVVAQPLVLSRCCSRS